MSILSFDWLIILGFVVGSVLGSFIKALADRSLINKSFQGRSYCPSCKHQLSWYDLFPVFSYLFLKGRCRYCHKKISPEYPLTEVILGIIISYLFYTYSADLINYQNPYSYAILVFELIFKIFIIGVFAVVVITDIKKTIIPDRITYPAIVISFFSLLFFNLYQIWYIYYSLSRNPIGRFLLPPYSDYFQIHALDFVFDFLISLATGIGLGLFFLTLILITKGKGMGGGDFKLSIFIGMVFGFPLALVQLMLSFLLGSIVGVGLLLARKKNFGQTIPFGPFLSIGGLITLFWGQKILDFYLSLHI
jgi:prepilin signal peptidase PulO-like enzyme (type II secretory pathway)